MLAGKPDNGHYCNFEDKQKLTCIQISIFRCRNCYFIFRTSNKHDWTPVKYLNVLHEIRTQKQLQHYIYLLLM